VGLAVSEHLAAAGYTIVIIDTGGSADGRGVDASPLKDAVATIARHGTAVEGFLCDVSDAVAIRALATEVENRIGPVEVVVPAAGIFRPGPFLDSTEDGWATVLAVHLGGHLNVIQAFLPGMLTRERGHLVNVTSTSAILGSPSHVVYSAAKEAVIGLTRYLGHRLAGSGVKVSAVAPAAKTRSSATRELSAEEQAAPELLRERGPGFVTHSLRSIRHGIRSTGPRTGARVVVVLPGWLPWLTPDAGLGDWLSWYGAIGAVRGSAATEIQYGVRVNGLAVQPCQDRRAAQVIRYCLDEDHSWLNGCVLACDQEGVGLLADERPRWQSFFGDSARVIPPSLESLLGDGPS
jgi:NAD(P)-dependent dehydrogenase (short-subunit alcohol dehydrogenase family)